MSDQLTRIAEKIVDGIALSESERKTLKQGAEEFKAENKNTQLLADCMGEIAKATCLCTLVNYGRIGELEIIMGVVMKRMIFSMGVMCASWKISDLKHGTEILRRVMFMTRSYTEDACDVPRTDGTENGSTISCMEDG